MKMVHMLDKSDFNTNCRDVSIILFNVVNLSEKHEHLVTIKNKTQNWAMSAELYV